MIRLPAAACQVDGSLGAALDCRLSGPPRSRNWADRVRRQPGRLTENPRFEAILRLTPKPTGRGMSLRPLTFSGGSSPLGLHGQ